MENEPDIVNLYRSMYDTAVEFSNKHPGKDSPLWKDSVDLHMKRMMCCLSSSYEKQAEGPEL